MFSVRTSRVLCLVALVCLAISPIGCSTFTQETQTDWFTQKTSYPTSNIKWGEFEAVLAADAQIASLDITMPDGVKIDATGIGARRTDLQTETVAIVEALNERVKAAMEAIAALADAAAAVARPGVTIDTPDPPGDDEPE